MRVLLVLVLASLAVAEEQPFERVAREFRAAYKRGDEARQAILAARPALDVNYTLAVHRLLAEGDAKAAQALAVARGDAPEGAGLRRMLETYRAGARPTPEQFTALRDAGAALERREWAEARAIVARAGEPVVGTVEAPRITWMLAQAHRGAGEPDAAAREFGRTGELARAIGWLTLARDAESERLRLATQRKALDTAAEAAGELVDVARALGDRKTLRLALAHRFRYRKEAREARADLVEAAELAKLDGDRLAAGLLLGRLALLIQRDERQPQTSLKYHEESLRLLRRGGDEKQLRTALLNNAIVLTELARYTDALGHLDELLREAPEESAAGVGALRQRAYVLSRLGRVESAVKAYVAALEGAKAPAGVRSLHLQLARLHLQRSDPRSALVHFEKVLANQPRHVLALAGRAAIRGTRGDEAGARADLDAALAAASGPAVRAQVLLQRVTIERRWGDYGAAFASAKEALAGFIEAKDYANSAVAQQVLADLLLLADRREEATEPLANASVAWFKMKQPLRAVPALVRETLVLLELGRADATIERFGTMRKLVAGLPDGGVKSAFRCVEAILELKQGKPRDDVLAIFRDAQDLAARAGDREREATALVYRALVEEEGGVELVERALRLLDERRVPELGVHPLVEGEHPWAAASMGARLAGDDPARLFRFVERARAERILLALGGRDAVLDATLGAERFEAFVRARGNLIEARATGSAIEPAEAAFDAFVAGLRRSRPEVAAVAFPSPPSLDELRAALTPDDLFLLCFESPPYVQGTALAVTSERAEVVHYDPEKPLALLKGRLKGKRRLIVAPDGRMTAFDFDEARWGKELLTHVLRVRYVTSGAAFLRRRDPRSAGAERRLVAVGAAPERFGEPLSLPAGVARVVHFGGEGRLELSRPEATRAGASALTLLRCDFRAVTAVAAATRVVAGRRPVHAGIDGLVEALALRGAAQVVISLDGPPPAEFLDRFYRQLVDEGMSPGGALRAARDAVRARKGSRPVNMRLYGVR